MEAFSPKFATGIHKRVLEGSRVSIKIINPVSGQTVGILKHSSIPCTSGCEFKYTECKLLEGTVLKTKFGYPKNYISNAFSLSDIEGLVKSLRSKSKWAVKKE